MVSTLDRQHYQFVVDVTCIHFLEMVFLPILFSFGIRPIALLPFFRFGFIHFHSSFIVCCCCFFFPSVISFGCLRHCTSGSLVRAITCSSSFCVLAYFQQWAVATTWLCILNHPNSFKFLWVFFSFCFFFIGVRTYINVYKRRNNKEKLHLFNIMVEFFDVNCASGGWLYLQLFFVLFRFVCKMYKFSRAASKWKRTTVIAVIESAIFTKLYQMHCICFELMCWQIQRLHFYCFPFVHFQCRRCWNNGTHE